MIKVSIIIPSLNVEKYVSDCLDSILNQSYQDYEIIFIDSSIDSSPEIIAKYIEKYPDKIKYFFQEKQGPSAARNFGIIKSIGKYIVFLDADDKLDKFSLEKRFKKIESDEKIMLVYSDTFILLNDDLIKTQYKNIVGNFYEGYAGSQMIINNFICTSTVLLKKEVFDKVGLFDEALPCVEDYELWLRICLNKFKIGMLDEPLTYYRIRKGSLSEDNTKRIETLINVFNKIKNNYNNLDDNELLLVENNIQRYHKEYFIFLTKDSIMDRNYKLAKKYYSYIYKFNRTNLKYFTICLIIKIFPEFLRIFLKNRANHRGFKY